MKRRPDITTTAAIPNKNIQKILAESIARNKKQGVSAPAILTPAETDLHRIECPKCKGGYAAVKVERRQVGPLPTDVEIKIPEKEAMHKCELCDAELRLKTVFKIIAIPWKET